MNYFCTLFNKNYLSKGLVMLQSLQAKSAAPHLTYVLCMDDQTQEILLDLNLPDIELVSLKDFENPDLLHVKTLRTATEYCWTCTPAIIKYLLVTKKLSHCTYLDADLFFFSDPVQLLDEVRASGKSVLITPHNYTKYFDQTRISGYFCVQFMFFQNDDLGREVLNDWYHKCLDWCYAYPEDGKLGDQKYLDVWPEQFPKAVHVLDHQGAVAPWNMQKFDYLHENAQLFVLRHHRKDAVVFFHFHSLNVDDNDCVFIGLYPVASDVLRLIYAPYIHELQKWDQRLFAKYPLNEVKTARVKFRLKKYYRMRFALRKLYWRLIYFTFKW